MSERRYFDVDRLLAISECINSLDLDLLDKQISKLHVIEGLDALSKEQDLIDAVSGVLNFLSEFYVALRPKEPEPKLKWFHVTKHYAWTFHDIKAKGEREAEEMADCRDLSAADLISDGYQYTAVEED